MRIASHIGCIVLFACTFGASAYDNKVAAEYAIKWGSGHNTEYPDYIEDCTNFASQALYAGGLSMIPSITDLYYSGLGTRLYSGEKKWYFKHDDLTSSYRSGMNITRSKSWSVAHELYVHLLGRNSDVSPKYIGKYVELLNVGDLIFFDFEGDQIIDHAQVVTGVGPLRVSAHTINHSNDLFSEIPLPKDTVVHGVSMTGALRNADYINGRVANVVILSQIYASIWTGIADRILASIGLNSVFADSSASLSMQTGSSYTAKVVGINFVGNERVQIDSSVCDPSTIQRGVGYFTERCVAGNNAGQGKLIQVLDSTYDINVTVEPTYRYMSLFAPIMAPNSPSVANLGSGTVRVNWSTVSDASGYVVSRNGVDIATLGATTTFDDAGRAYGVQVCYRVRALANGVMSVYSPEQCITLAAPAQCVNQWTSGTTAIGGSESTVQSCPSGQVGSITLYHLCQASGNSAAWSGTSTTNTCTVPPLSPPSNVSAARYTQNGLKGIRLSWSGVSGADSYFVYKLGVNGIYAPLGNQTSFIDTLNLKSGASYCYTVRAQSGNRVSADSDVACSLAP